MVKNRSVKCTVALNDWVLDLYRPPIIVLVEFAFLERGARMASNDAGDNLNDNECRTPGFAHSFHYSHYVPLMRRSP